MVKPKRSIKIRGNYNDFANSLAALWGIDKKELENHDYNYKEYYNDDPSEAYAQLNKLRTNDPTAHFPDTYKLPTHPTFSVESKYSGKNNNVVGGTWKDNPSDIQRWTYQLSPSQRKNHWNVRRTLEYAGEAEDEGFKVIDDKGRYPVINGIIQGGVLPTIIVRPKYKEGGIHIASSKRGRGYAKTYTDSEGKEVTVPRMARETDEHYEARYAERVAMVKRNEAASKARFERRIAANKAGAARLNRAINTVTNVMEEQAKATPFTGQEIQQAAEEQRQEKLDKWEDYKKGINATITATELGLSGASLLGAYANWRNWATAANATKRGIANLLQKAQLPMQIGGTLIDGYQTYDALQNNDNYNANYNGISTGLGVAGSVGASDVFLNSRFHSPKIDRVLDAMGVIQNSGDFIKFGYDSMFGNKKAYGGSIHIAPSKRGTFTAAATKHGMGVQEFASRVLRNKDSYSPAMVKKANFARNASKWNH